MPNDMQGVLSRDERHLATAPTTSADLLAWIDAHRLTFEGKRCSITFINGAWIASAWEDEPDYDMTLRAKHATFREALQELIAHKSREPL